MESCDEEIEIKVRACGRVRACVLACVCTRLCMFSKGLGSERGSSTWKAFKPELHPEPGGLHTAEDGCHS